MQVVEDMAHDAAEQAQPTADAAKEQVDAAASTVKEQVRSIGFTLHIHPATGAAVVDHVCQWP